MILSPFRPSLPLGFPVREGCLCSISSTRQQHQQQPSTSTPCSISKAQQQEGDVWHSFSTVLDDTLVTLTHTYTYIYTCYYYIYTHTGCMCLQYIWLVFHRLSSRSSVLPSCACPRWWHVGSDVTASRKEQQGSAGSESLELQQIPTNRGVQTCHSMKG